MSTVLSGESYEEIKSLSEEGNVLIDKNDFIGALRKFQKALVLVPDPKSDWEAGMWLYSSIGDMYYFLEEYQLSIDNFYNALNYPGDQGNVFAHLRLGESFYELDNQDKALDHLLRAYMLQGSTIFENEDEKYFSFLKTNVEGVKDIDEPITDFKIEDKFRSKWLPPGWDEGIPPKN